MNTVKVFLMTALLASVAVTAFGQQKPAPMQPRVQYDNSAGVQNAGQPGGNGPMSAGNREEVRKKIDAVRIWRLTEALKLDAGTSAKLSAISSSFDLQRQNLHRSQMQIIYFLQLAVKSPKPDESKIKASLENLEKNHQAMEALKISEMNSLKDLLTVEQQARYIVFQHEFMSQMRGMIDTTRSCGQGGTGMRSGGGPGAGQLRGTAPGQKPGN